MMIKEKEYYTLRSCGFSDGAQYVSAVGTVYLIRNKVFIVSIFIIAALFLTSVTVLAPVSGINAFAVLIIMIFVCAEAFVLSYILAYVHFRKNRSAILGSRFTLTFYEGCLCEQNNNSEIRYSYDEISSVILTFEVLAIISGDTAIFIPTEFYRNCAMSELLGFMLARGANINGNTMRMAAFIDMFRPPSDDDFED